MYVRVYRNLNKKALSVQRKINGRWLVVAHCSEIVLWNVTFTVNENKRLQVLENKVKNVHAFIYGYIGSYKNVIPYKSRHISIPQLIGADISKGIRVTYDPYRYKFFTIVDTNTQIKEAKYTQITNTGLIKCLT